MIKETHLHYKLPLVSQLMVCKWASMSIHYTNGYPSKRQIQSAIRHYNDYGAIMMFDLRDHDVSETTNYFAPYIWEYRTVSWTGTVYPKDY